MAAPSSASSSKLLEHINHAADNDASFENIEEEERVQLLTACEKLKRKLQTPRDALFDILLGPHQAVAIRLGIDMKLFDFATTLADEHGVVDVRALASAAGAEVLLVVRIMRMLTSIGIFKEVGENKVVATKTAAALVTGSIIAALVIHVTSQSEPVLALPSYFEERGYASPTDAYDGPFQYARRTNFICFDWLATKPKLQQAFHTVMEMPRADSSHRWFEFFPVQSKLISDEADADDKPILVDIGGGTGHELIHLATRYPELRGRLVVQDIPVVVQGITSLPSGIEAVEHDFFAPQPVKGAKAYYLGNVLHDWPDKQASLILGHIKDAMRGPQQSILLVNENVVAESGMSLYSAAADLLLMANISALERTQNQFEALLHENGFRVVEVWRPESGSRRLFEAVIDRS